jgi:hypothetical protein
MFVSKTFMAGFVGLLGTAVVDGYAAPAFASRATAELFAKPTTGTIVVAKHGADDGAGHDRGDNRGRGRGKDDGPHHAWQVPAGSDGMLLARNGADDGAGHDRNDNRGRGRGKDDGPHHG